MKIPKNDAERELFYQDIIQKCLVSQEERSRHYGTLRNYYLFGADATDNPTPYNKVFPHIDLLTAFLFSSETTKFAIHIGADVHEAEVTKIPRLSRAVNDEWLASNADLVFSNALTWALVYNTTIVKSVVKNGTLHPFVVEPHCFGVLREDLSCNDRQEAMVHTYYTTKSQLQIDIAEHPQKTFILSRLQGNKVEMNSTFDGLDRIILLNTQPNIQGNVNTEFSGRQQYIPKVDEDLIQMQELWIYDDEIDDYRTVTRAENVITIYDRKNVFIDHEVPFVQVCPNPMYGYYWGGSEVERLIGLQKWRNERIDQMRDLLDRQVKPPKVYNGMGIQDEKLYAFDRAGGWLSMMNPMDKVQEFAPQMPNDLFAEIHMIDEMFSEQSGLQNLLMGKGESGVRSGRQTSELARLGSARVKKRALVIEDSLEKLATLYLKFLQAYDKRQYKDSHGQKFIAAQFTDNYVVKVDGHSNSPLFVEDHKAMAGELFEAKAIDRRTLIEMLDPPGKDILLMGLKEIEKKEAEAAKAQQQAEKEAAEAKSGGQLKQVK